MAIKIVSNQQVDKWKDQHLLVLEGGVELNCAPVPPKPVLAPLNQNQEGWNDKGYWWVQLTRYPRTFYIVDQKPFDGDWLTLSEVNNGDPERESTWKRASVETLGEFGFDR